jgi:hypothetical protein
MEAGRVQKSLAPPKLVQLERRIEFARMPSVDGSEPPAAEGRACSVVHQSSLFADDSPRVIVAIQGALRFNGLPDNQVRKVEESRYFLTKDIGVLTVGLLRDVRCYDVHLLTLTVSQRPIVKNGPTWDPLELYLASLMVIFPMKVVHIDNAPAGVWQDEPSCRGGVPRDIRSV